jgi:hypothetical protein
MSWNLQAAAQNREKRRHIGEEEYNMENRIVSRPSRFLKTLGLLGLTAGAALTPQVTAEGRLSPSQSPNATTSPVYWNWDAATAVGTSTLVRTNAGLSFTYHTSLLPAGQVVTVWIVVFNNPENCATHPCTAPADVDNPDVHADFLYGGGHIIGGSGRGNFGGHLSVGDASGSGLAELGFPAVGLLDPFNAEVILALHSHGPAASGQVLKAQLSSFLGGCQIFLGPDGIADGPEDMPVAVGECSTFQYSVHQP